MDRIINVSRYRKQVSRSRPSFSRCWVCFLLASVCKLPPIKTCYSLTFLFSHLVYFIGLEMFIILHFCQRELATQCVCILILCLNLLSYPKIMLDFPMKRSFSGYVYMEKFIDPAFPASTKMYFSLLTFFLFFYFFIFAYFVNLTPLIHSHAEQCFYYKNYTSILKNAFNIQISITNSFHNLRTNVIGNLIGYLIMI